jgi:ribosomal protein S18 acetylase RimI-like enzyme
VGAKPASNSKSEPELVIVPATPDRWRDLEKLFGPERGANSGCWCMWWRLTRTDWRKMPKAERKARFRKVVTVGPPVGLLAFRAGAPVGWVQVAPRRATPTFNTSPVAAPSNPQDDLDQVWAISCFYIAARERRAGVANALAAAAVEHAFAHGAAAIEACPKEPEQRAGGDLFTGTPLLFRRLGFREVARRAPLRPLLRRERGRRSRLRQRG